MARFTFKLSAPYAAHNPATDGPLENFQGTLSPRDLTAEGLVTAAQRKKDNMRPPSAMYLKVSARTPPPVATVHAAKL
jgi:hypothetical protein